MATEAEIARLRLLIGEPTPEVYTDADLNTRLDTAGGDLNKVAYDVWTEKAAAAAELVDISEGGSSRKMGDIYEQALNMAKHFGSMVSGGVEADAPRYTVISKLRR